VLCVGWGSPTKRPHSWVTAYNNSSDRCRHPAAPDCCGQLETNQSPSRQRNRRHQAVTNGDQNGDELVRERERTTSGGLLANTALSNPRCRGLIDDRRHKSYTMYDHHHHPAAHHQHHHLCGSETIQYLDRTDVYRYQQPEEDNRYLSNGNIRLNNGQYPGKGEINSNVYPVHKQLDSNKAKCATYGIDPYNGGQPTANPEYHRDGRYGSPDHRRTVRNKYPDNHHHLDYNTNQLDWSPEKVSSSGSSFDSGYHSNYGSGTAASRDCGASTRLGTGDVYHGSNRELCSDKRSPAHSTQTRYQLCQKFSSYQGGIKRTLDKCEDHCIQVIHPSLIWAEQQSEWESIILVKVKP